jgi:low temperature requirement protein LtrA
MIMGLDTHEVRMTEERPAEAAEESLARFRRWFWRPPRAHGEIDEDRTVSFLELFNDLVYVVVIAQAAHHLAAHISPRGFLEFAVIFGLIWIAWFNGTIYHDMHGQEDGRTRMFVFAQMAILALLAVFTGDAAGSTGMGFALVYVAFLIVLTWLWYAVRRRDPEEFMSVTGRYLTGMLVTIVAMTVSAFLPDDQRLAVWAAIVVGWIAVLLLIESGERRRRGVDSGPTSTDSMVERFGLFTIIVLGEVVVGVVDGLGEAELDALAIGTGLISLTVGFGLWWIYFDFVGRRRPTSEGGAYFRWMLSHLPVVLAIAAAGAAMVSLIEHAHDARAPADTAWLLSGSVSIALVGLILIVRSLVDYQRLAVIYRPISMAMGAGAVVALVVGWLRPAPWLLALLLLAILAAVWFLAVDRYLRNQDTIGGPPNPA